MQGLVTRHAGFGLRLDGIVQGLVTRHAGFGLRLDGIAQVAFDFAQAVFQGVVTRHAGFGLRLDGAPQPRASQRCDRPRHRHGRNQGRDLNPFHRLPERPSVPETRYYRLVRRVSPTWRTRRRCVRAAGIVAG